VSRHNSSNELPAADRPTTQGQVSIRQSTHRERIICLYLLLSLSDIVCRLLLLPMPLLPLPALLLLLPGPPLLLWLLKRLPLPGQFSLLQSPLPPFLLQLLPPVGLLLTLPLTPLLLLLLITAAMLLLLLLFAAAMLLAEVPWFWASDFCCRLVTPELWLVPLPSLEGSCTRHAMV